MLQTFNRDRCAVGVTSPGQRIVNLQHAVDAISMQLPVLVEICFQIFSDRVMRLPDQDFRPLRR
jgi:hypothetical protein